jgi:hypothetical protein
MTKNLRPEKYGMRPCPGCSGKGYCDESYGERKVCGMCGGFGFIKKEKFGTEKNPNQIMSMNKNFLRVS